MCKLLLQCSHSWMSNLQNQRVWKSNTANSESSMSLPDCVWVCVRGKHLIKLDCFYRYWFFFFDGFCCKNLCCQCIESYCEANKSSEGFRFQFIMNMDAKKRMSSCSMFSFHPSIHTSLCWLFHNILHEFFRIFLSVFIEPAIFLTKVLRKKKL